MEYFGDFLLCYWCMFIFVGILFYIALFVLIAHGIYINIIYRNKLITLEPGEPTLSTPLDSRIRKKRLLITCGIIVAGILYALVSTPIGKWIITYNSVELSEIAYTPEETLISTNLKGRNKKVITGEITTITSGKHIFMM